MFDRSLFQATCLETALPLDQVVKAVASHLEATVPATLVARLGRSQADQLMLMR